MSVYSNSELCLIQELIKQHFIIDALIRYANGSDSSIKTNAVSSEYPFGQ